MATQWNKSLQPLLKQYKGKHHPLDYRNPYELLVVVVLSAQTTDALINKISPAFFTVYPDMSALARADAESVHKLLKGVRNFGNKTKWLLEIASKVKTDKNIPKTMEELTALPGLGRKSANVIMRGIGVPAEGVIVDLHVVRVAPRIGIAEGEDPKKIEQQIMEAVDKNDWGEVGMAISFLGREICRPTNPLCTDCVMSKVCAYYTQLTKKKPTKKRR